MSLVIIQLTFVLFVAETRLIRTNRDEWFAKDSTNKDEKHRNKLVFILLKALSYSEPEKAVYIFKSLLVDQYISYYPIGKINKLIIDINVIKPE